MQKRLDLYDPNKYDHDTWRIFKKNGSPIYWLENFLTGEKVTLGRNIIGVYQLSQNEFLINYSTGKGQWKVAKYAITKSGKKEIFKKRYRSIYIVDNKRIELDGKYIFNVYTNETYESPATKSGKQVSTKPFTI